MFSNAWKFMWPVKLVDVSHKCEGRRKIRNRWWSSNTADTTKYQVCWRRNSVLGAISLLSVNSNTVHSILWFEWHSPPKSSCLIVIWWGQFQVIKHFFCGVVLAIEINTQLCHPHFGVICFCWNMEKTRPIEKRVFGRKNYTFSLGKGFFTVILTVNV